VSPGTARAISKLAGTQPAAWSLKTRITAVALAVFLLAIWSLTLYATSSLRQDMTRLLGEQQFSTTSIIAAQLNAELESRLQALAQIAGEIPPALLDNRAGLQRFLEQRSTFQKLFNGGTRIRDAHAVTLASVPYLPQQIGSSYADRDYMVAALQEGRASIGRPVISRTLKSPAIALAAPIRDPSGKVVGALTGVIDLGQASFFDRIVEQRYGRTGGYLIIAPQHGLIVTGTDRSRAMSPMPPAGVNRNHDRFVGGYEGYGVAVNSRGVEELAAAKGIPVAGWFSSACCRLRRPTSRSPPCRNGCCSRRWSSVCSSARLAGGSSVACCASSSHRCSPRGTARRHVACDGPCVAATADGG
jgi:hypothetical protein